MTSELVWDQNMNMSSMPGFYSKLWSVCVISAVLQVQFPCKRVSDRFRLVLLAVLFLPHNIPSNIFGGGVDAQIRS